MSDHKPPRLIKIGPKPSIFMATSHAVNVVPTFAPIIIAKAPRSVSTLLCAKPTAIEVTADDDCTTAVVSVPTKTPSLPVRVMRCKKRRKFSLPNRVTSSEKAASPCKNSVMVAKIEKASVMWVLAWMHHQLRFIH